MSYNRELVSLYSVFLCTTTANFFLKHVIGMHTWDSITEPSVTYQFSHILIVETEI